MQCTVNNPSVTGAFTQAKVLWLSFWRRHLLQNAVDQAHSRCPVSNFSRSTHGEQVPVSCKALTVVLELLGKHGFFLHMWILVQNVWQWIRWLCKNIKSSRAPCDSSCISILIQDKSFKIHLPVSSSRELTLQCRYSSSFFCSIESVI